MGHSWGKVVKSSIMLCEVIIHRLQETCHFASIHIGDMSLLTVQFMS